MRRRWPAILVTAAIALTGCSSPTQTRASTSASTPIASSPAAPTKATSARPSVASQAAAALPLTTITLDVHASGLEAVRASFSLTRLLPLSDARLASTLANLGFSGPSDPPLGCSISNPERDLAAVGTFTATASAPRQLAALTFGMFVGHADADPAALLFGPNCGNVGRDGYEVQTADQGEKIGPLPVEIVVHGAQANPALARQLVLGFGAGEAASRSVATLTTTSPYAQIVSPGVARLLVARLP